MNRAWLQTATAFLLLCFAAFVVIYKTVHVPVTADERNTSIIAELRFPNIMLNINIDNTPSSYPNNHILNTVLLKITQLIFGQGVWQLRLPNALSFFLMAACILFVATKFFDLGPVVFLLPVVIIFYNPYLLDFFGMARGYALGNCFLACSVTALLLYAQQNRSRYYYAAMVFAALAAYAQFSLLLFWASLNLVLLLLLWFNYALGKQVKPLQLIFYNLGFNLLFIAAIIYPLVHMQNDIQRDFSTTGGFFNITVISAANRFLYGHHFTLFTQQTAAGMAVYLVLLATLCSGMEIIKKGLPAFKTPLVLVTMLILITYTGNQLQVYLFKTGYLADRCTLIYQVLLAFVIMFLIRQLALSYKRMSQIAAAIVIMAMLANFFIGLSFKSVYECAYDAYTYDVVSYIDNYRKQHNDQEPVDLKLGGYFYNSFSYYTLHSNLSWLHIQSNMADSSCASEFYYIPVCDTAKIKQYRPLQKFGNEQLLMILK